MSWQRRRSVEDAVVKEMDKPTADVSDELVYFETDVLRSMD